MEAQTGQLVRAEAGRGKGALFCIAGGEGEYLLLADGKRRKLASPKRKKLRHVSVVDMGGFTHPALTALGRGEPVTDRALRRALAAFREESKEG